MVLDTDMGQIPKTAHDKRRLERKGTEWNSLRSRNNFRFSDHMHVSPRLVSVMTSANVFLCSALIREKSWNDCQVQKPCGDRIELKPWSVRTNGHQSGRSSHSWNPFGGQFWSLPSPIFKADGPLKTAPKVLDGAKKGTDWSKEALERGLFSSQVSLRREKRPFSPPYGWEEGEKESRVKKRESGEDKLYERGDGLFVAFL